MSIPIPIRRMGDAYSFFLDPAQAVHGPSSEHLTSITRRDSANSTIKAKSRRGVLPIHWDRFRRRQVPSPCSAHGHVPEG